MKRLKWHCHSTVAGALYKIIVSNSCSAVFRRRTHETVSSSVPGGTAATSVVDTMLHDSPDLVIHRTEIWTVWRPQVWHKKVWRFLTQQSNWWTCAAWCAGALSCWNHKVVTRHTAYRLRQYDVIMTSWSSKRYQKSVRDITRISCL